MMSYLAVAIPAVGTLFFAGALGDYEILLWLLALVPAFYMAYHRGWRGVVAAVMLALAVLLLVQLLALGLDRPLRRGPLFVGVLLSFAGVAVGVGILAEMIHRERRRAESAALTDALTGIPNRRFAELMLPRDFAGAKRGRHLSIVLFDLDDFKAYNDLYGHAAGDEALRRFAQVLVENTRAMNLSARWGGEEFISLLSSTTVEGAVVFAERVRAALAEYQPDRGTLTVTAGVAGYGEAMTSPKDLLSAADDALYRAKTGGRDQVGVHDADKPGAARPGQPED